MISSFQKPVRKIIHLDMDAFFASVEIKDNPELKGLPVVVGGSPTSRSVVCAASYQAREFGIHSAMPCSKARQLCPEAVFIFPRFERYQEISLMIHEVFLGYTDLVEPVSLDEAWLDVTNNKVNCPSASLLAEKIKEDIRLLTGLSSSAGVSYNKFLAKIASDEKKPDGLFVISPKNALQFLKTIPVKKLPGVGKVTFERLRELKIEFGYQLFEQSSEFLRQHFGKFGNVMHDLIRGIDDRPVMSHRERKSVGIENTFETDILYGNELKAELNRLLSGLTRRIAKLGKKGRTLTLKIKFMDFTQITRSVTDDKFFDNDVLLATIAHQKLFEVCQKEFPFKKVRLIGLGVSNFEGQKKIRNENIQLEIFPFIIQPENLFTSLHLQKPVI
ncbi:MAG: DNA polymerase IV [Deltaproteobacteria bacterium]|nr:DNA polymerase IV [Deltaproteobacteria bacterium]